jgi:hypothetical protein
MGDSNVKGRANGGAANPRIVENTTVTLPHANYTDIPPLNLFRLP